MRSKRNPTEVETDLASDRAMAYYDYVLQYQLTDADKGRYIAIDGNTLEWEISDTRDASDRLKERVPDALILMLRHVYIAVEYFGCLSPEVQEALDEEQRRISEAVVGLSPDEALAVASDRLSRWQPNT